MKKVCIIGAGIGGCSLSYYLRENKELIVDLYEKKGEIGGRIKSIDLDNNIIEIGASFFHSINKFTMDLISELGLELNDSGPGSYGIWNGKNFIINTKANKYLNIVKLLIKYKTGLFKLRKEIKSIATNIKGYYKEEKIFRNLSELLMHMGLKNFSDVNLEDYLKKININERIIQDLIEPALRLIYLCAGNISINSFAGFSSLIASNGDPIYSVKGGNIKLCEELIAKSTQNLFLDTSVVKVIKNESNYKILLSNGEKKDYDVVVIATPMFDSSINFDNMKLPKGIDLEYIEKFHWNIKGSININHFSLKEENKLPNLIFTTKNLKNIHSIPEIDILSLGKTNSNDLWGISSCSFLEEEVFDVFFSKIDKKYEDFWKITFPSMRPQEFLSEFIIDKNLYYLSAIDSLAPTIETSVIMAKNISKLLIEK